MPFPLTAFYLRITNKEKPEEQWLGEGDGEAGQLGEHHVPRVSRCSVLNASAILLRLCVGGLAFYGLVDLSRRGFEHTTTNRDNICACGNSAAEAVAMGCKYDLLASAWLPDRCRDDELTAEFNRAGPGPDGAWDYFADNNGTVSLVPSEVGLLADTRELYYTTNTWHIVHCLYYWRKLHRTRFTRATIEARYDHEGHIKHCGKVFLDYLGPPIVATNQHASLSSAKSVKSKES